MHQLRFFSLCLVGAALTLSACGDKDAGTTGPTTAASTTNSTTNASDTGDTGSMTTFAGDGDGDPTTTTATTTTTMGFVPDEDFGAVSECDPFAQDCPDGEKCVAYGSTGGNWDANKCVQVMGDGQVGDPCMYGGTTESTDDCGQDSWCWNVNMDGVGTCTAFCTGSADDPICEPGYGCSIANDGSINICLLECDPLLQDCPNDGDWCFYDVSGNFVCAFGTQDLPTGEPCGFINDCVGGNVCLDASAFPTCNGSACCASYCDLSDPGFVCVPDGTECTAFFDMGMAPPGYENVGVCIIPGA